MKPVSFKPFLFAVVVAGALFIPGSHSDAGDPPRKVTICHKGNTLEVSESALQAHLAHGDTMGPCSITPGQNR